MVRACLVKGSVLYTSHLKYIFGTWNCWRRGIAEMRNCWTYFWAILCYFRCRFFWILMVVNAEVALSSSKSLDQQSICFCDFREESFSADCCIYIKLYGAMWILRRYSKLANVFIWEDWVERLELSSRNC